MRFVTLEVLCFFARVFLVGAVLLAESVDLVSAHESHVGFWLFVVLSQLLVVLLS